MAEDPDNPSNPAPRPQGQPSHAAREHADEDLWDLDDDLAQAPGADAASTPSDPAPHPITPEPRNRPRSGQAAPAPVRQRTDPSGTSAGLTRDEELNPDLADDPLGSDSADTPRVRRSRGLDGREKVGLAVMALLMVGIAIWWATGLFRNVSTTRLGDDLPDMPAKGQHATLVEAETFWREPIREGDNPDVARPEIEFIPVFSATLDDSSNGALRVIFRNAENEFVGDPITHGFSGGKFNSSGEATIHFPATDGLTTESDMNAYRVNKRHWTAEVLEGPSTEAPGSSFRKLLTFPISSNSR